MGKWFIGIQRAEGLLDYALARLAMQAHRLEPKQYLLLRKFLEARIPLWVEERRGPVDRQGKPLLSEQGYKDFIKWWVLELIKPRVDTAKEEPTVTKKHWAEQAFGNNAKTTVAASRPLRAGALEDLLVEEYNIGPDRAAMLKGWVLDRLLEYTGPWAQGAGLGNIDAVITEIKTQLDQVINAWEKDENLSPLDPTTGTAFAVRKVAPEGVNQADQLRRALDESIYEALYTGVVGSGAGKQGALGWQSAYGFDPITTSRSNLIPYAAFTEQFPQPGAFPGSTLSYSAGDYNIDPKFVTGEATQASTMSTFFNVYQSDPEGLGAFAISLQFPHRLFGSFPEAKAAATAALNAWPQSQTPVATTYNGVVVDTAGYATTETTFENWALAWINQNY